MSAVMPAISVVDVGEGGLLRYAELSRARARALREDCLTVFPRAVTPFLPSLDGAARRWLTRSCSPYVPEIAQIAAALGFPRVESEPSSLARDLRRRDDWHASR